MDLQAILDGLKQPYWPDAPEELLRHRGIVALTKAESKRLFDEAMAGIEDGREGRATNALYAGLVLDHDRFMSRLRQDGVLRLSKRDYEDRTVLKTAKALSGNGLGLPDVTQAYLRSVCMLHRIAVEVRKEQQMLLEWMEAEREVGLKGALATLDLLFLTKATKGIATDKRLHSRHPYFHDAEEMAVGFSSLLALYGGRFGRPRLSPGINRQVARKGEYVQLLIAGAHLAAYREWELLVDRFGYTVAHDTARKTYRLEPPEPELERALRLGFIQTRLQGIVKALDWIKEEVPYLSYVAGKISEGLVDRYARLARNPDRYTFDVPDCEPVRLALDAPFFYQEERLALLQASRDLLVPIDELLGMTAAPGVTFRDFVKAMRVVNFLRWYVAGQLLPLVENCTGLVLESLVPCFTQERLVGAFAQVLGQEEAARLVEILTMRIEGTGHLDIQYRPILATGGGGLLPTSIAGNSNLLRNAMFAARQRLFPDGEGDPLPRHVAEVFRVKGHPAAEGVNYAWQGSKGDIDVLVLIGDILFALECKRSLLPAGPQELLTSYDCILDAAGQLDRFRGCFADPAFRTVFGKKLNWSLGPATRLVTGIVMPNRMFMGYRLNGHAVRGSYEVAQFVDEGTVSMDEESLRFWAGAAMTGEDLRRFFEEDITYRPIWDCMNRFQVEYRFGSCKVQCGDYLLDQLALAERLGFPKAVEEFRRQMGARS